MPSLPMRSLASRLFAAAALVAAAIAAGPAGAQAFRFEPRLPFADVRALLPPLPPLRSIVLRADDPPKRPG